MTVSYSAWPSANNTPLQYVVIMARYQQQWLLCRHQQRQSWDIPGGKIDADESPLQAAARELQEETGAVKFELQPIEIYQVDLHGQRSAGLLCLAEVSELGALAASSEMTEVKLVDECPQRDQFTHGAIQPLLFEQVVRRMQMLNRLRQYQHLIWDWNGTIADDAPLSVELVNQMLQQQQLPLTNLTEYRQRFCHPVEQYYADAGFDFAQFSFEQICQQFGQGYKAARDQLQLQPGVRFLLTNLAKSHRQSILSAASQQHLAQCVEHHQLQGLFDEVFGLDNHHAVSKVARGQQLLAQSGIAPEHCLMIGDTDHDLEVAQALGIDCLLIAAGHQSYGKLSALHDWVLPDWH